MSKVHVVPNGDSWNVKKEGQPKPVSSHSTQKEAIQAGKPIAKNNQTELVIHRPNGKIRESWSYGNDPFPPKG